MVLPQGGTVLISSFLQPLTGGQDQDVSLNKGTLTLSQRSRAPQGRVLCIDSICLLNKTKGTKG